jgi:hypothetical protein
LSLCPTENGAGQTLANLARTDLARKAPSTDIARYNMGLHGNLPLSITWFVVLHYLFIVYLKTSLMILAKSVDLVKFQLFSSHRYGETLNHLQWNLTVSMQIGALELPIFSPASLSSKVKRCTAGFEGQDYMRNEVHRTFKRFTATLSLILIRGVLASG